MDLHERLRVDLKQAMRDRDGDLVATLRIVLGALANAEAVGVEEDSLALVEAPMGAQGLGAAEATRRELTDEDVRAVLRREADDLAATVATYRAHDQREAAEELDARISVLEGYLT